MSSENRILVVDDDKNICELVRLYLEKEGYAHKQNSDSAGNSNHSEERHLCQSIQLG